MQFQLSREPMKDSICFALDHTLDLDVLRLAFSNQGRLYIPMILQPDEVFQLYESLCAEPRWGTVVCGGRGVGRQFQRPVDRPAAGSLYDRLVFDSAYASAGLGGSHLHDTIDPMSENAPSPLKAFVEFLNSKEFVDFARILTNIPDISHVKAQAARYRCGHFFGFHKDVDRPGKQKASCVFNLNPHWMAQWGGILQFKRDEWQIEVGFLPRFNSLSIFLPSLEHAVSWVSPIALSPRYSVAAALMAD